MSVVYTLYTLCLLEGAHQSLITKLIAQGFKNAYRMDKEKKSKVKNAMEENEKTDEETQKREERN